MRMTRKRLLVVIWCGQRGRRGWQDGERCIGHSKLVCEVGKDISFCRSFRQGAVTRHLLVLCDV